MFNEKPSREEILAATQVSDKPRMRGYIRTEVLMCIVSVATSLLEAKPLCYHVCPGDAVSKGRSQILSVLNILTWALLYYY